jgi:tRNA (guanine-N7-)-methyltransferase
MGKNKLKKFAEMEQLPNVFQCSMKDITPDHPVVRMAGRWRDAYFRNSNPLVLELGCGHGEYTVGLARLCPDMNFIGIDIKGARMWAGARQAHAEQLPNVAFLRTGIEWLPSFFAAGEVDELWITFPDPQMKKASKRLTSTFFMQRYLRVMRSGGLINLKTDSPFLYTYTRAMLEENRCTVLADTGDLYACDLQDPRFANAGALQTHYEHQWLDRGLTIKFLCWRLEERDEWREPDIEIEKDTYRSYGRNYTVSQ